MLYLSCMYPECDLFIEEIKGKVFTEEGGLIFLEMCQLMLNSTLSVLNSKVHKRLN
jgi:hypothetical protein